MKTLSERLRQMVDDIESAAPGDCVCDEPLILEAAEKIEDLEKAVRDMHAIIVKHTEVAKRSVNLFTPPYRGHCGVRLHETDRIMDDRMDALSDALQKAGYGWEEWT